MSGETSVKHGEGRVVTGIWWGQYHDTQPPTTKNYHAQNAKSTKDEKPWVGSNFRTVMVYLKSLAVSIDRL
jgi:hypothetical protein